MLRLAEILGVPASELPAFLRFTIGEQVPSGKILCERVAFWGWVAVCISMGVGLLMGAYAFGGPLPAPAAIGDYATLTRTLLRDAHVVALGGGLVAVVVALSRPGASLPGASLSGASTPGGA